ncbi:amidohydrolase [Saccharopolyspora hattusasensis]|uniref:amidohydrolase n=1 Tax=Saccharopolyspora hattusasensis TaxID=1128679 RepID=UPI003D976236
MPDNDVCVVNARVVTMDDRRTIADSFRFCDGVVVSVGDRESVLRVPGDPEIVDLHGATVLPGLIDAHSHLELLAYAWEIAEDCRAGRVSSVAAIVDVLRDKANKTPAGEWVLGQGEHYQHLKLTEGRYPDRHDLDQVSVNHPVMYRASYHLNVFNSRGLRVLGVDDHTPDAPGGRIERDTDGTATGRTYDMFAALGGPQPPLGALIDGIKRAQQRYLSVGVTALGDILLHTEGLDALLTLEDDLLLRTAVYPKLPTILSKEDITSGRLGAHFATADPARLRLNGVKIFLDGGLTAGAAALHDDYPGQPGYRGELAFTDEEVREIVRIVDDADLQIAMHAIGDRALDQAIDAVEALPEARHGVLRHRIEHAGNMFMTSERVKRLARAGIVPVPQPAFLLTTAPGYVKHLGRDRIGPVMPFRTLIDAGLPVPGNSDAIGITPDQHHPFPAMQAAISRRSQDGAVLDPQEAITVDEAIAMYTRWAAYSLGRENEIGSIEIGKHADFVVTGADPLTAPDLGAITVEATWLGGRKVYSR